MIHPYGVTDPPQISLPFLVHADCTYTTNRIQYGERVKARGFAIGEPRWGCIT